MAIASAKNRASTLWQTLQRNLTLLAMRVLVGLTVTTGNEKKRAKTLIL